MRAQAIFANERGKASVAPVTTRERPVFLQRQCDCGGVPKLSGQCRDCQRQRSAGSPGFRAKLAINQPGDEYEREADRVADRVMGTSEAILAEPGFHKHRFLDARHGTQGRDTAEKGTRPELTTEVAAAIDSMRGAGRPLDAHTRAFMESRFGHDFSQIRIHSDARAAVSADAVAARAYTVGRDIVFAQGQFSPQTTSGKRLLAHELTHVIQQRHGGAALQRQSPGSASPSCPTDIRVVKLHHIPFTAQAVSAGWRSGGGAVAEMEVSDLTNRDWVGTKIHETTTAVAETCGKTLLCGNVGTGGSAGSTWPVGEASTSWGMNLPSKRNTFYDWHFSMIPYDVLGREGLPSCASECEQTYDCVGGAVLRPKFSIERKLTPNNFSGNAVTQIAVTKPAKK